MGNANLGVRSDAFEMAPDIPPDRIPPPDPHNELALDLSVYVDDAAGGDDWRAKLRCKPGKGPRPSFGNLCVILENTYATRLSFDEMAAVPYFDGRPLQDHDVSAVRRHLEDSEGLEFSREKISEALLLVAHARSFHPIRGYLRGLRWDGQNRIERVATEILHVEPTDLAQSMIRRFFTAAVARPLDPGCKVDTALLLVGPQGYRKSTFFDVLGGEYYRDSAIDITDRKGVMVLHSAWIYEWPEIERIITKRTSGEVKHFMSERIDSFVPMFGRAVQTRPRSCIIVGTTNEQQFLSDPTGSRRFWILRVTAPVNVPLLQAWRDQLWAEAVDLHRRFMLGRADGIPDGKNPFKWWLEDDEDRAREELAAEHEVRDPWEAHVKRYLDTWYSKRRDPRTTATDILTTEKILLEAVNVDKERQSKPEEMRVGAIMRKLGHTCVQRRWPLGQRTDKIRLWLRGGDATGEE